jgi:hypothetical protein
MMSAADYRSMSREALEDADRTDDPGLKVLYQEHSRQWLALAAAASQPSSTAAAPVLRLVVSNPPARRDGRYSPMRAKAGR